MKPYTEMYMVTKDEYNKLKNKSSPINKRTTSTPIDVRNKLKSLKTISDRRIKRNIVNTFRRVRV